MEKHAFALEAYEQLEKLIDKQIIDYLNLIYPVPESQKFKTWPPAPKKYPYSVINFEAI